jgi:hypothetical protein
LGILGPPGNDTTGDRLGNPDTDSLRHERAEDHRRDVRFAGIGVGAGDEEAGKSLRDRGFHADSPGIGLDWFALGCRRFYTRDAIETLSQ